MKSIKSFLIYADYDILFIDCIHYEFMVELQRIDNNMAVKLQEKLFCDIHY